MHKKQEQSYISGGEGLIAPWLGGGAAKLNGPGILRDENEEDRDFRRRGSFG